MLVSEIQRPFADLKETEKGQRAMTEALAKLVDRGKKEGALAAIEKVVRNMAKAGFAFDQIVELTDTPADEVQKIMDDIAAGSQAQLS